MITKQDISEIKTIISSQNYHDILRSVAGVYVNSHNKMVHSFHKPIHHLPEDEIFKYLKIAGEIPNVKGFEDKTIELEFRLKSGVPSLLRELTESGLKEERYLIELYERIIDNYETENGFLILIFHGVYDVIKRTTDGNELDESEEVYNFLLCAVCPVNWDKPGLKYDPSGKICAKQLQEIVGKPESGFIWPAFENRSANQDKCLFYSQKPKKPQHDLMTDALDCHYHLTASEYRMSFEKVAHRAVFNCTAVGTDYTDQLLQKLNMVFGEIVKNDEAEGVEGSILTDLNLAGICKKNGINEVLSDLLISEFRSLFQEWHWPRVRWLYDREMAALAKYNQKRQQLRTLMSAAAKVCEANGQQDLAQEIEKTLEEMQNA